MNCLDGKTRCFCTFFIKRKTVVCAIQTEKLKAKINCHFTLAKHGKNIPVYLKLFYKVSNSFYRIMNAVNLKTLYFTVVNYFHLLENKSKLTYNTVENKVQRNNIVFLIIGCNVLILNLKKI